MTGSITTFMKGCAKQLRTPTYSTSFTHLGRSFSAHLQRDAVYTVHFNLSSSITGGLFGKVEKYSLSCKDSITFLRSLDTRSLLNNAYLVQEWKIVDIHGKTVYSTAFLETARLTAAKIDLFVKRGVEAFPETKI